MPNAKQGARVARIFADGRQIDEALKSAVKGAIRDHQRKNAPIVVWRNGRAVLVSPRNLTRARMSSKRKVAKKRGR